MDITYNSITIMFSCIVFVIVVWKFLNWAWFAPRKLEKKLKDQGFKGDPYRIIFLQQLKSSLFHESQLKPINLYDDDIATRILNINTEMLHKYGKRAYTWFGPTPLLVITQPELLKEVLVKNYQFQKLPQSTLAKLLMKGISSLEGEQWAKHRKIIGPAFHIEKVKLMVPSFHASISELLTKWEEIVSLKGSSEIDVWPDLQKLTSDIISRTAFGSNYEEGKEIFELQREQAQYSFEAFRSFYLRIPGWRFIPTKTNRRMKEIYTTVNHKIHCIIKERLKAGEAYGDDFLGLLLESNSKEGKEFGLTIQDVIEECKLLYVAGQETTAVLLVWTMILLARHPEWQNRAREEVLQFFGNHQVPTDYNALNQLKIVTMILHEVLRLYPPPAGAASRMTIEETKLGNLTLPKGVVVLIPIVIMHHDSELWGKDVNKFKPERFAEGVPNATKGQFSFFPFSWGPRICLGQNFAMMEAKMTIAMILQRFSFQIAPSYSHNPFHSPLSTIRPKLGAQLILHKL